jgi:succinoglycan biosynthesis protein ExoU
MSTGGVAVIITAYNAEATIARSVRSALAQPPVREVFVVDDGSADGTVRVAREADDGSGRLTVLRIDVNEGPAAARNRALGRVSSPYISILDADDFLLPGRIERLFSSARGEWDFLADDIVIVPEGLAHLPLSVNERSLAARNLDFETFVRGNIARRGRARHELGFLKPLIRRAFLQAHQLRYRNALRLGEDFALYAEALLAGARFQLVSACGYVAVERAASLSSRHTTADLRALVDFDDALLREQSLSRRNRTALRKHRDSTWRRLLHREVLDRKAGGGYGPALAHLLMRPQGISHVVAQTISDKWSNARHRMGLPPARKSEPRFLVGFPQARLHVGAG